MFLKLSLELFYCGFNVPEPSQISCRMLNGHEETKPNTAGPVCRTARDEKVAPLRNALRVLEHEDGTERADADQPSRIRLAFHSTGEISELGPTLQPGIVNARLVIGTYLLPGSSARPCYLRAMHNNNRPEWRGAEDVEMQTGRATPRPL